MSTMPQPLDRNPALDPSQDFYRLRREGISHIQGAGSDNWTDYNVHDPGITILEGLCYTLTDLGYRINWPIKDILTPETPSANPLQPYPNQSFYTARSVLTINPTTTNDFRRVLIDLPGVRDAWLVCKTCACETSYWVFCDASGTLVLQYEEPVEPPNPAREVHASGLYDVLLELEEDAELGDLNDRMVSYSSVYHDGDGAHPIVMELRFPDISLLDLDGWRLFLDSDATFADRNAFTVELLRLGAIKGYDLFTQSAADQKTYIQKQWKNVFYLSLRITIKSSGQTIDIDNAALRVFADAAVRNDVKPDAWRALFTDTSAAGFVARYHRKARATFEAVVCAKQALQQHRNLDEDYCLVSGVGIEDVAVCADIELRADADVERVQANIWFQIEQYFSPAIRFRTLEELQDRGQAVEDIFNGPELESGFIEDIDLDHAQLLDMLHGSDLITRLMGIDGVIAVNQLRMTKYDSEGNVVAGAADPVWNNGQPTYDPNRTSAAWLLSISPRHQPRLYLNQSRFLFYKSGLPFAARTDEATDTLNQLLGDAERPKNPNAANDLPIPTGLYRNPEDYFPIQYGFPLTYGIGSAGLPSNAPALRVAQARDLKAYLMVFEQLLGNAMAQLAHTADLFSLDPGVVRTYFVKAFDEAIIKGFDQITTGLTPAAVGSLIETLPEFQARRNAFLDHLLARFGEDFNDYALLLTNAAGEAVAQPRLIDSKIAFLRRYPLVSHDRARAFNYRAAPRAPANSPGIKKRISLLLGYPDLNFTWTVAAPTAFAYPVSYTLRDGTGRIWLEGQITVGAADAAAAEQAAYDTLMQRMILADAYTIAPTVGGYALTLADLAAEAIGHGPGSFGTQADAAAERDALLAWSANERLIVVEHLLLRPKFVGDALYPACCDGDCATCGNEDPYSFRLTYVMPGWTEQYTDDLDLRRYAERTIQRETPSHLLGKTCWVGNDGFVENPCDDIIGQLADLLVTQGSTSGNVRPTPEQSCACANALYRACCGLFATWYGDKKFAFLHQDAAQKAIAALLQTAPDVSDGGCTLVFDAALWDQVRGLLVPYFVDIALRGWQFERFEWAWGEWLNANALIDWTEERLVERVEAILTAGLEAQTATAAQLCDCAQQVVSDYGSKFYSWMQGNVLAGKDPGHLTPRLPSAVTLCPAMSFQPGTQTAVEHLLNERYAAYVEPSYWLWAVVTLLANLRNTYPGATLHDCADVSDQNPVRLDSTALGNYPRRTPLQPS